MQRKRRDKIIIAIVSLIVVGIGAYINSQHSFTVDTSSITATTLKAPAISSMALTDLQEVTIKGRAPKTGYTRAQFGDGWETNNGCDTRDTILKRDLTSITLGSDCHVLSGVLNDPYTAKVIQFKRGVESSSLVQIDHVVPLSNAWQTGAQALSMAKREAFANDPSELLAVDGPTNQQKSDGDAATWLPPNKSFRCTYVSIQIGVKLKYGLWMTQAEHDAIQNILNSCPGQTIHTD